MENVQTKTETKPSASKKRARRASPVFRKIVLGKPVRLEEIDTQGTPARIAEKDRLQKQEFSLSLSSAIMTEFVARNLKNFFDDSIFIYKVLRNGTEFAFSNRVVSPKIKNDAVKNLNETLDKALEEIKEIEKNTYEFLRARKVKPQSLDDSQKYIVTLEYDNLADRKLLVAIQKADSLLFQQDSLYRNGGFGFDLIKAEDELAAQRKRIVSILLGSCVQCRKGRRSIRQAQKDFFDEQEKKKAEKKQKEKELEERKQAEKEARENRMKEAKALEAINSVMSMDKPLRRLSTLMQNITEGNSAEERENSIPRRLAKWYGRGAYAWVFDNVEDKIDLESKRVIGIDGTDFLDNSITKTPVAFYLLHRVKQIIDGRRGMIFMDEFWAWLNDEAFRKFAEQELKTIRKKNAIMVFATQSPSDVLNNPIARTVVEQTSTQIMLPNEKADEEEYVKFFKATPEEYHIVVKLPAKSRFFLVKQLNSSSLVRLDLSSFSDEMTVFSSTTVNVEIMHEVREELKRNGVEDKPENWLPVFYEAVRANKQQKKRTLSTKR